jgi:carbamoyl-phosphate synthase small subunit
MKAILVLQDGTVFEGESLGASGRTYGEVVFNTGMTGYQEILTDPSYAGQIVTLTYPLIGNYGINPDDFESRRVQVEGFVVREAADMPSNWRAVQNLHNFLKDRHIVGIKGVDTRALTRSLRVQGVMMGTISTDETAEEALARLKTSPSYEGVDFARKVTTEEPYRWYVDGTRPEPLEEGRVLGVGDRVSEESNIQYPIQNPQIQNPTPAPQHPTPVYRVALLDCGVKYNILRSLAKLGCETTVFPCTATAAEILRYNPDGIMLSPGPGDPALLGYVVDTVRELVGRKPIMGVCLGNQIIGCAFGSKTYKLKFGHRGSNHPVKDLTTGRVYITSQNHGYAIDPDGLQDGMEVAHVNLNDGTVEGLRHRELPIFTIQYHPEASPGPTDSRYFFTQFVRSMEDARR